MRYFSLFLLAILFFETACQKHETETPVIIEKTEDWTPAPPHKSAPLSAIPTLPESLPSSPIPVSLPDSKPAETLQETGSQKPPSSW